MIKTFKVTNFCSIRNTQEISFEIKKKDILDSSAQKINNKLNLNLITTLVGHNASGKTNALKALAFLIWFVRKSYTSFKSDKRIPVEPHKLEKDKPTVFEVEFLNKRTLYKYRIELTENKVLKEYFGKHVEKNFTRIFEYERENDGWVLKTGSDLKINKSDHNRFKKRKNISVLSSLIDTGYLDDISFFNTVHTNVGQLGYYSNSKISKFFKTSENIYDNKDLQQQILSFVKNIDIGISGFSFTESILRNIEKPDEEIKEQTLECIHGTEKKGFALDLIEESDGTLQGLYILSYLFPILKKGGIAVLDEIEDGLHPHVLKKVISLFESKETNPKNAQLLFATHQHLLLNDRTKTQIYLAEKNDKTLETELFRLDEVEDVRNDENYFQKYLAGVYGGVGKIDWF